MSSKNKKKATSKTGKTPQKQSKGKKSKAKSSDKKKAKRQSKKSEPKEEIASDDINNDTVETKTEEEQTSVQSKEIEKEEKEEKESKPTEKEEDNFDDVLDFVNKSKPKPKDTNKTLVDHWKGTWESEKTENRFSIFTEGLIWSKPKAGKLGQVRVKKLNSLSFHWTKGNIFTMGDNGIGYESKGKSLSKWKKVSEKPMDWNWK